MHGPDLSWDIAGGGRWGGLRAPLCSLLSEMPPLHCARRGGFGKVHWKCFQTFCLRPAAPVSCACGVRATSDPSCGKGLLQGKGGNAVLCSLFLFRFLPEDGFAASY